MKSNEVMKSNLTLCYSDLAGEDGSLTKYNNAEPYFLCDLLNQNFLLFIYIRTTPVLLAFSYFSSIIILAFIYYYLASPASNHAKTE